MALSNLVGGITGSAIGSAQTVYEATESSAIKVMNFFNSSTSQSRTVGVSIGNIADADSQIREYVIEPKESKILSTETFIFENGDKVFVWETSGSGDVKVVISDFQGL